jgi:hypothetical protein
MAEFAQTVGGKPRHNLSAEPYGAKLITLQVVSSRGQVKPDKGIIEIDIVRHEYPAMQQVINISSYLFKRRRFLYHFVADAGERPDINRYIHFWVNQRAVTLRYPFTIMQTNSHLGNAVCVGMTARGFDINDGVHGSKIVIFESESPRKSA